MTDAGAIVLAGGKSTRMGTDKALVQVNREGMLRETLEKLSGIFQEIIISANNQAYGSFGLPVVPDAFPGCGPLAGIHAGLMASHREFNFVVACDMPFIDVNLAEYLVKQAAGHDAAVPRQGPYFQPLFAVYAKSCLPAVLGQLEQGNNKTDALFGKLKTRFIEPDEISCFGSPDRIFFNVNTGRDLEKARKLAAEAKHG